MLITDEERERLVAAFPWVKDFDAVLRCASSLPEAVARLRSIPVRKVSEVGQRKRTTRSLRTPSKWAEK